VFIPVVGLSIKSNTKLIKTMNDFFDGEWKSDDKPLYTKLPVGETKLRIVSKAIIGWEGWFQNKPVRFAHDYKITPDEYATLDRDNFDSAKGKWKMFGVCVVYNYTEKAVQYWMFSQKQIRDQLVNLANDKDWGDITKYDIKIRREGEKMETKYTVNPLPAKPLAKEVEMEIAEKNLVPTSIFNDQKNLDNIETFRKAIGTVEREKELEIQPEDVPF